MHSSFRILNAEILRILKAIYNFSIQLEFKFSLGNIALELPGAHLDMHTGSKVDTLIIHNKYYSFGNCVIFFIGILF